MIFDLAREKQKRGKRLTPREWMHIIATTVINLPSPEELLKELQGTQDKSIPVTESEDRVLRAFLLKSAKVVSEGELESLEKKDD